MMEAMWRTAALAMMVALPACSAGSETVPASDAVPTTVANVAPVPTDVAVVDRVVIARNLFGVPQQVLDELLGLDELTSLTAASLVSARVAGTERQLLALSDPAAFGVLAEVTLDVGSFAALDEAGTVVVAAPTAEQLGVEIGDSVEVDLEGTTTQLRVVGLAADTSFGAFFVSDVTVSDRRGEPVLAFVMAARSDGVDEASARTAVQEVLEGYPEVTAIWTNDLAGER